MSRLNDFQRMVFERCLPRTSDPYVLCSNSGPNLGLLLPLRTARSIEEARAAIPELVRETMAKVEIYEIATWTVCE